MAWAHFYCALASASVSPYAEVSYEYKPHVYIWSCSTGLTRLQCDIHIQPFRRVELFRDTLAWTGVKLHREIGKQPPLIFVKCFDFSLLISKVASCLHLFSYLFSVSTFHQLLYASVPLNSLSVRGQIWHLTFDLLPQCQTLQEA